MCVTSTSMGGAPPMDAAVDSLYGVLGLSMKATAEEIRLSYLRLARLWHPDRHRGAEGAKRKFQQIQCAYEVLSDESRRASYDLQWLDLLDVETYLHRYKDFLLTANGLGMSLGGPSACPEHGAASGPLGESAEWAPSSSARGRASIKAL
ncbi:Chaperone protein dnaJ 1, mitochondrial [Tetrabaena socialis]|uniref:Chaperone protein dnaJ 1, mitochondrial n=1 Tax=Tetrabaena socialis TaxID=47790 RepID=A0A2J8A533_9CHLO|nr:Chaperone protein dnaJ 1, mitochondrial [Tetrabaena socialis]|eukprot:PNH07626.1 Chaperone protein dnaJ 1, mitochondrial [Tetrabaena socialis]